MPRFSSVVPAMAYLADMIESQAGLSAGDALQDGLEFARQQSSGGQSSAELASQDHPFATRHGSPRRDLLPINIQTGVFLAAWTVVLRGHGGQIINNAPHADDIVRGGPFVFARPIDLVIEEFVRASYEHRIRQALARLAFT